MTEPTLTISDIQKAATEGSLDGLWFKPVELASGPDCELNCGLSGTTSLRAAFVRAWPNHDGSRLVLELRDVNFQVQGDAARHRDEAFAYILPEPPLPKIAE
ncbi:MAG: hypothetical protein RL326_328 [Pseudomonadota bacterium]|jgi:hypothetical protein